MGHLILTLKPGRSILIGNSVTVELIGFNSHGEPKLRITAPESVSVDREEVRLRKQADGFFQTEEPV